MIKFEPMKKLFILISAITISISGMSQSNGKGKGHYKNKADKHVNKKSHDSDDDYNRRKGNSSYTKGIPSKVRAAFQRDFPNATNVAWTKDRGNWTARFGNGIFRHNVTYHANGQRIDATTARRRSRTQDQTQSSDGSVWDRILTRQ
jgi:hypothetical protein